MRIFEYVAARVSRRSVTVKYREFGDPHPRFVVVDLDPGESLTREVLGDFDYEKIKDIVIEALGLGSESSSMPDVYISVNDDYLDESISNVNENLAKLSFIAGNGKSATGVSFDAGNTDKPADGTVLDTSSKPDSIPSDDRDEPLDPSKVDSVLSEDSRSCVVKEALRRSSIVCKSDGDAWSIEIKPVSFADYRSISRRLEEMRSGENYVSGSAPTPESLAKSGRVELESVYFENREKKKPASFFDWVILFSLAALSWYLIVSLLNRFLNAYAGM